MILEHIGLSQINGSLVVLDGVKGVQYDEMAELHLDDGSTRVGRVVRVDGDRCVIQVFEGTRGLSLVNNRTVLTGHPMMMDLSPELLGRVLDGGGPPPRPGARRYHRAPPRGGRASPRPPEARHRVTERVARVAQQPHAGRFSSIGDDHIRRLAPCPRRAVAEHDGKQQIRRPRRDQEDAPRQVCCHHAARKARHRPQTLP